MKSILHDTITRNWSLSGLIGLILIGCVLLEEGQARTYSPPAVNQSLETTTLNPRQTSSESLMTGHLSGGKASREEKAKVPALKKVEDKNPEKKRMGLAILFLGILAEES